MRVSGEILAQFRVLGRYPHGAGIQVTDSHHDATQGHQWPGSESEFLRTEQGGYDHIPTGLELPICFNNDPVTQVVEHQGLVGFGQAKFPGQAGVFDAADRRSACAAVIAADQDHVRMRFGHTGGDGANTHF